MKVPEQKIILTLIVGCMIFATASCGLKCVKKHGYNLPPEHLTAESLYPSVGRAWKRIKGNAHRNPV